MHILRFNEDVSIQNMDKNGLIALFRSYKITSDCKGTDLFHFVNVFF